MARLLHIADVHLGRRFSGFGEFGKTLRQQVRDTFRHLLRDAAGNYDLVVLAGDIFDSNHPDPRDVTALLQAVRAAAPLPVFLLPGTHDRLSTDSVYRRPEFAEVNRPANLRLFDADGPQSFLIDPPGIAVHGRANLVNRGGEPPLKGISPDPRARFNIAIAHASVPMAGIEADDEHDYYVRQEDAAASGMNYVALGHWHRFQQCFPDTHVSVWYPGPPECVGFVGSSARGTAAAVTVSDSGVEVKPVECGRYRFADISLDLAGQEDDAVIREILDREAGAETVIRLTLAGRPAPHFRPSADALEEEFEKKFAWIEVRDQTQRTVRAAELRGAFLPGSIGDVYCRLVEEKLKDASEEQRRHYSEVLRRGAALLLGKEGVRS